MSNNWFNKFRKPTGEVKFMTKETNNRTIVCDNIGRQKGYCQNGSTFDNVGRRVAIGEDPALVFESDPFQVDTPDDDPFGDD